VQTTTSTAAHRTNGRVVVLAKSGTNGRKALFKSATVFGRDEEPNVVSIQEPFQMTSLLFSIFGRQTLPGFEKRFFSLKKPHMPSKNLPRPFVQSDAYRKKFTHHPRMTDQVVLNVRVLKAQGLAKMDLGGKSGPYVVLTLSGSPLKHRTTVKDKTLDPVWNESFQFPLGNPATATLTLLLRDKDLAVDEDLAALAIPLKGHPCGTIVEKAYTLTPAKGVKAGGVTFSSCGLVPGRILLLRPLLS
jgi:hypothetical protein